MNKWTEADSKTLHEVVNEIKQNIILRHPNFKEPFHIYSDASKHGISCVLTQKNGTIAIFSAKSHNSERNCSIVEQECLALVKGILVFKPIIYNSKIVIHTDNLNLTHIKDIRTSRYQRWKLILEEFDYTIEHIQGDENTAADYFSRNLLSRRIESEDDMHDLLTEISRIQKEYSKHFNNNKGIIKKILIRADNHFPVWLNKEGKLVIPKPNGLEIIKKIHEILIHPGESKLYYTIKHELHVKNIKTIIHKVTGDCQECRENKNYYIKKGKLNNIIITTEPKRIISSDIYGPIIDKHYTKNERWYIITFTDIFTRRTKLFIMKDILSSTVLQQFKKFIQTEFKPEIIISDQGKQYLSHYFIEYCKSNDIIHRINCTYTPTANGVSERINQTITTILRIQRYKFTLHQVVKHIEFHLNNTYNRQIKNIPNILANGNNLFKIAEVKTLTTQEQFELMKKIKRENLNFTNQKRKKEFEFKVGMEVMIRNHSPKKLDKLWIGPYKVKNIKANDNVCLVERENSDVWCSIRNLRVVERDKML